MDRDESPGPPESSRVSAGGEEGELSDPICRVVCEEFQHFWDPFKYIMAAWLSVQRKIDENTCRTGSSGLKYKRDGKIKCEEAYILNLQ